MSKNTVKPAKLSIWQERLSDSNTVWLDEVARMDQRERLYNGDRTLRPLVKGDTRRNGRWKETSHVRNIVFENIESQVSSTIPSPIVTAVSVAASSRLIAENRVFFI